jgi:hypothetical protein
VFSPSAAELLCTPVRTNGTSELGASALPATRIQTPNACTIVFSISFRRPLDV